MGRTSPAYPWYPVQKNTPTRPRIQQATLGNFRCKALGRISVYPLIWALTGAETVIVLPEAAGFRPMDFSGILFMPGWLRVLDLWCHVRLPRLAKLTGRRVQPFARAYKSFPAVRRHGYLIAWAVRKPGESE